MKKLDAALAAVSLGALLLGVSACERTSPEPPRANPIVGAWLVKDAGAPFPFHMYVFNADGTLQQANPDAGDPRSSDSDGKGVWVARGERIKGKWLEVTADRATHKFAGRTEISFDLAVQADAYTGTETVTTYDADGVLTSGPSEPTALTGQRITIP